LEYVYLLEAYLEEKGLLDEDSFKLVILKHKWCAYSYYTLLLGARAKECRSEIKTWGRLKTYLDKKFLTKGYTNYPKLIKGVMWRF